MAGEQFMKILTERGGSDSEYSDVTYGRVISVSPLKAQIFNSMIIDDNFVMLGKHIGNFSMSGNLTTTEEKEGKDREKPKTERTTKPATFTFDNSLRVDDKVTIVHTDGGQQFYLFGKESG